MKIFNINFKLAVLVLLVSYGCQDPDELLPSVSRQGLNSITANFEDGRGEFIGYLDTETDRIVIPVPYYFPVNSTLEVTPDMLSRMRVNANLDDNVTVEPSLLYMDLTTENTITVTDQRKQVRQYTVVGEIRKSSEASIEDFSLPSLGLSGVVNEDTRTISIISFGEIEPAKAEYRLSAHATIDPDPAAEALDYNEGVELTVTAHDGTQNVYTVQKAVPGKLPYGIRAGSGRIMFAKQLKSDLGITVDNLTGGIAATGEYVVINTRNYESVVIDAKTGERVTSFSLGSVQGSLTNFYSTADASGTILVNNLAPNDGSFKVWKLTSIASAPELMIEWDGGVAIGRKLSVQGSLDADAVITAPIFGSPSRSFARWVVSGGVLTSQVPDIISVGGLPKGWTTNADVISTSATNPMSDYFVASYSDNQFAWVNGQSNTVRQMLDPLSTNYIQNAVDYIEFNNASFAAINWINSFNWGSADMVWLLDVSSPATFSGDLSAGSVPAVQWASEPNVYGGKSVSPPVVNGNGTGDVALTVSENGYYLYLYFMFTNGYVVGVQFDAIDM
ncbi:DUF5018 domain-containing protein [Sinomicrobium oceani]|uniref:DUF5018 domain-containing protein n=1 Tax=Sinomicrobium oceani TaxID=1150368 RepID=UPI00227ADA55|nr:DUF5018 domain-containing protein [Sinomicrobium oceani]